MDKAKKKRIKKYITWISMALVVALLAAMPLLARQEAAADGPVASILSAEAKVGTVTSALHGGGTLCAETVEEVKLPEGVKITGFLVKNGQMVTEGTPVATVDKVSVMTAITEVNETMKYLREELENARDEKISSSIRATAGGRVKKLFAQKGESVQEVMVRDGALAILSLDSLMAVKIEGSFPVTTGESVDVTLSDGEEVTGRVESNLDGVLIITVEDEGYEIGQTVSVCLEDETLGEGTLYIHNAWKATAYSGTIENVSVKEEQTLSIGANIFTLKDRDYEGELRRRSAQHREYEALLQELLQMYESGYLTAPCDGEIEGVDEDSAYLLSAVPEGWVVAPLSNTVNAGEEKPYRILLLSGGDTNLCKGDETCTLPADSLQHEEDCIMKCDENIQCDAKKHKKDCIKLCDSDNRKCSANVHYDGCISVCTGKTGCQALPEKHNDGCPEKCTNDVNCKSTRPVDGHGPACVIHCVKDASGADGYQCKDTHAHYEVCIGRCTGGMDCTAINHKQNCELYNVTYTARIAIVVRSASGTIEYKYDPAASAVTVTRAADGRWILPSAPNADTMNTTGFVSSGVKCNPGTVILIVTAKKGESVVFADQVYPYSTGGSSGGSGVSKPDFPDKDALAALMGGKGGFDLSSMIGGFAGFGNYGAVAQEEEEPLFDLEGNVLLTVTPHETATLTVSIDEHDIAKLTTGMEATVTVEALKGQTFPAEITNISLTGTNSGGSSKFAVELTLPMNGDMLSGMSASAVIPLEEKSDVLLIPAAALTQQGAKTMVFTALDEKTGEPIKPVEVKTGLSDGEQVEILSGLTEGQKVYYSYYDTVELDTSAEADKYTLR